MTSRWNGREPRSLGSGAVLLGLVVVWPALLWTVAGWPLPTTIPHPRAIQVAFDQRHLPGEVVVAVLAVMLWLLWAQLMWALLWELVVNGRRLARGSRSAPAPFVIGPLNSLVAKLVSGVVAAGIMAGSSNAVVALPADPIVASVDEKPQPWAEPRPTAAAVEVDPATATWFVSDGDSLWSIAETTLGDGARTPELLALNPDLGSARALRPGMTLALPVGASVPAQPAGPADRSADRAGRLQPTTVEVVPGDNLWRLSEQRLGGTDPAATDASIAAYVRDVVAQNPAEVLDPDLIHPGQLLRFPALNRAGQTPPFPSGSKVPGAGRETETASDAPLDAGLGHSMSRTAETTTDSAPIDPTTAPTTAPTATAAEVGRDQRSGSGSGDKVAPARHGRDPSGTGGEPVVEQPDTGGASGQGSLLAASDVLPVSLGAAGGLLASGALGAVRRRRSYRQAHRTPGTVPAGAGPGLAGVERAVLRLGDDPDAEWMRAALASLSARPVWQGEHVAQPVLARLSDDQLIVELSGPDAMGAPLPWRSGDGGESWSLPRDTPQQELESFHARSVTPTFVTVGVGVMVNLEALGVLKVCGPGDGPRSVVRSLVHELATSPSAGTVDIRSTIPIEGIEAHQLVQERTAESLLTELVAWLDETERRLSGERSSNAYASRVVSNGDSMAPVIVVTDAAGFVELTELAGRASKRSLPVALVVTAEDDTGAVPAVHTMSVDGDRALLAPWGIELDPQLLPAESARRIGRLLVDAADGGEKPLTPESPPSASVTDLPSTAAGGEADAATAEEAPQAGREPNSEPDITVCVLGAVEAEGVASELTSLQLSLLTFLACNGPASRAVVIDALWDGQSISRSRFPNVLAELRSRIGRQHLPEMTDGRYELIGVTTDLGSFEAALVRASSENGPAATETLRAAVELVRGEPLTTPGRRFWTWVDDHTHIAARVEALVADTAARLARRYCDAGEPEQARWACEQGLAASPSDEHLVTLLTEVYLALGKRGSARRLVDGWEDRISRMECGEPSEGPRRRLVG